MLKLENRIQKLIMSRFRIRENVDRRWIYLPVEVKGRELLSKLLIAYFALNKGFGVFIGRNGMNIGRDFFPRGIYFDKCLSNHKIRFHQQQVVDLENVLVSHDEEGLLFASEENYASRRMSQSSINLSTMIFLWGSEQEKIFRNSARVDDKLVMTGSPRIDLWSPELNYLISSEAVDLEKKFGSFILVVSNWGYTAAEQEAGIDPDKVYPGNPHSFLRSSFLKMIARLAETFPRQKVIVRPHPVESLDYWQEVALKFADIENVVVIGEGAISPWLRAAKAVIHNNCTTGLEAWIGEIKPIVYSPHFESSSEFHRYTFRINSLGSLCHSESEVIHEVQLRLAEFGSERSDAEEQLIQRFILRKKGEFAAERIVNLLNELEVPTVSYQMQRYGFFKRLRFEIGQLKWRLKDFFKTTGMYTLKYTLGKNPGIESEEIEEGLKKFSKHFGLIEESFNVIEVDKDTFCIFSEKNKSATEQAG